MGPLAVSITPASLMVMAVCFLNITSLLLILRFVVRRLQKFALGLDDWFILPAWFFLTAMCVDTIAGVAYQRLGTSQGVRHDAFGFPARYGTNDNIAQANQFAWAEIVLVPLTLAFAKISVLFFYRRMLCPENLGPFHRVTQAMIYITAVWGLLYTLLYVFQCRTSFEYIWNPTPEAQQNVCFDGKLDVSFSWTDALLDVIILILPIRKIMSLRLPTAKKVAIIGAFGVGGVTTAVSIIRAVMNSQFLAGIYLYPQLSDEAMTASFSIYWSLLECGTAVIVACLPSLQYIFKRFLPEQVKKSRASGKGSGTKSAGSNLKSVDVLEKASVMTQSTMDSRRHSLASAMPTFNSRPGTPAMEAPPPMPETPATGFQGFHSRTATLASEQQSTSSGSATPVSARQFPQFHKRTPSSLKSHDLESPTGSRTSTMNSQTPFFDQKPRYQ